MTLEELKKEFTDQGFRVEGDNFIHEFEDPHTVINGVHPKKRFEMVYVCEGNIRTVSEDFDSDEEPLYEFDILGQGRQPVVTICISNFDDFTNLVQ
jgi:hypothetical protein